MDFAPVGLEKLRSVESRDKLIEAMWDLRDSAYDEPGSWTGLTAETFFQALAEALEDEPPERDAVVESGVLARDHQGALLEEMTAPGRLAPRDRNSNRTH